MSNSGRTAPLALFIVILVAALGAAWWLVGDESAGPGGIDPTEAEVEDDGAAGAVDLVGDDGAVAGGDLADDAGGTRREALAADAPADGERSGGPVTIRGRVDLVPGTPADERLVVVALDAAADFDRLDDLAPRFDEVWARFAEDADAAGTDSGDDDAWPEGVRGATRADANGGFELELEAGPASAHLVTLGRYTFAMTSKRASGDGALLPVELGAWISGRVGARSTDAAPAALEGLEVSLSPDVLGGFDLALLTTYNHTRDAELDAAGAFELRGVPAVGAYALHAVPDEHAAFYEGGLEIVEGEHRTLEIALDGGASVRGVVVDPDERPVVDARVVAIWRGAMGQTVGELRETRTGDDGTFALAHTSSGGVDLLVAADGLLETRLRLEPDLAPGEVREGVRVVMDPGRVITGRVEFPDGRPAAGARVNAGVDLTQFSMQSGGANLRDVRGGRDESDEDGRFEIRGVSDGRFLLTAEVGDDEPDAEAADGLVTALELDDEGSEGSEPPAERWRASKNAVDPDAGEVVLVLERLVGLEGRVVDALTGEPLDAFTVRAELEGSGGALGIGAVRRRTQGTDDDDGAFRFDDLEPATWSVDAAAEGYARSASVSVRVPRADDAEPLVLRLERAASVAGVVVDPNGRPVAGATVVRKYGLAGRVEAQTSGTYREVFTESDGSFVFDDLPGGTLSFVADAEDFAPSEARAIDLVNGQRSTGLRLELREGGVLTGEVFGEGGAPAPGMMVSAQLTPEYTSQHITETDADGRFEMEHLEPGTWQIVALPNMMRDDSQVDASDSAAFMGTLKMATARIVDRESTHVVLGAPPANPVEVTGIVTRAGRPVEGAMVTLLPETDGDAMGALRFEVTGEDGRFAVTLDEPAPLLVTVQTGFDSGVQNSVEFLERVPEGASEHAIALELPGGVVEGTVTDEDGRPLVGTRVSVGIDGPVPFGRLGGGSFVETVTDGEGRYEATNLHPGAYQVAVGGNSFIGMLGPDAIGGRQVRRGVVVGRDERVTGVDFELVSPGTITGRVVAANGAPVAGAGVFARFEDGTLVDRMSFTTTDDAGRFEYAGLAPGAYFVSARQGDLASAETGPFTVKTGEATETELVVGAGTILAVKVVDPESDDLEQVTVSVRDEAGREYAGSFSMGELVGGMGAWFSMDAQRVGPVPAGTYTVTASHADGRSRSRRVTVEGGERAVTVRLR